MTKEMCSKLILQEQQKARNELAPNVGQDDKRVDQVLQAVDEIIKKVKGSGNNPIANDMDLVKNIVGYGVETLGKDFIERKSNIAERSLYFERNKRLREVCEKRKGDLENEYKKVWGQGVEWESVGKKMLEKGGKGRRKWRNSDTILVDRRNEFFWCKVPKAASTSWVTLFVGSR